ncbi:FK506-binding protein-like [Scyliorhinus canicula]|uniref:FK506-binding protein-like n=1 Tax=Scyliorhinus canicula TaxID=7830 RepID=UPI0018F4F475|nr:FK506-binding protein-like [Scyliorhinus canicula]XP_038671049.1 FK506-binding protein-like [Scyliorhinus canicula]XP_038671050.1 FK506-binding protein-like [Scyliorhinus canicula]
MAENQLSETLEVTNHRDGPEARNPHAPMKEWTDPAPFTWACPDGFFVKKILQQGSGLDKPKEGCKCQVCVEVEPSCNFDAGTHFQHGINQTIEMILGESDTQFTEIIEKCVETMLLGEQCEVLLAPGLMEKFTDGGNRLKLYVKLEEFTLHCDSWQMGFEEKWQVAMYHKVKGTEHFKSGNLFGAARRYAKSLRLLVTVKYDLPLEKGEEYNRARRDLYSNLAACQLKQKQFRHVIQNCSKALEIDPDSVKCLYRRGQAYASINEFEKARDDCRRVLLLEPGNTAAAHHLRILNEQVKAQNEKIGKAMSKLFI